MAEYWKVVPREMAVSMFDDMSEKESADCELHLRRKMFPFLETRDLSSCIYGCGQMLTICETEHHTVSDFALNK